MTPDVIAARFAALDPASRRSARFQLLAKLDQIAAADDDLGRMLDYAGGAAASLGMMIVHTGPDMTRDLVERGMEEERAELPFMLLQRRSGDETGVLPLGSERDALDAVRRLLADAIGEKRA